MTEARILQLGRMVTKVELVSSEIRFASNDVIFSHDALHQRKLEILCIDDSSLILDTRGVSVHSISRWHDDPTMQTRCVES